MTIKTKMSTCVKYLPFHKATSKTFLSSTYPASIQPNHLVFSFGLSANPSGFFHLVCSPTARKENYDFKSSWNWHQRKVRELSESIIIFCTFLQFHFVTFKGRKNIGHLRTVLLLAWGHYKIRTFPRITLCNSTDTAPAFLEYFLLIAPWPLCSGFPHTPLACLSQSLCWYLLQPTSFFFSTERLSLGFKYHLSVKSPQSVAPTSSLTPHSRIRAPTWDLHLDT